MVKNDYITIKKNYIIKNDYIIKKKTIIFASIGVIILIGTLLYVFGDYIFGSGDGKDKNAEYIIQYDKNKEAKKIAECTKCHTVGASSVVANNTINRSVCYVCHNQNFEFLIPISSAVHQFHEGKMFSLPQGNNYADRHKKDAGICTNCHRDKPIKCQVCHKIGPHVRTDKECVLCHNFTNNLFKHSLVKFQTHDVFGNRSCNMCHAPDKVRLQLANGVPLPMTEPSRLCRQCHYAVYEDWSNKKHISIVECTLCHNPHSPRLNMSDINFTKVNKEAGSAGNAPLVESTPRKKYNYGYYEDGKYQNN